MILNAKRIHSSFNFKEISPQELNKCLQKFYFRQEKATTAENSVIARQNCNRWQR